MTDTKAEHTLEQHYEIWNDKHGTCIKIGPDRDGLGLISIRSINDKGSTRAEIVVTLAEAELLLQSLGRAVADLTSIQALAAAKSK